MLPKEKQPFKMSKVAMGILLTSILMANILALVTISNIRQEQEIMENFLLQEGQALIRSFEAGMRTSLRHHTADGKTPLMTLVEETSKSESIAYIRIVNDQGHVVATAGDWPRHERPTMQQILASRKPQTTLMNQAEIFEVASIFNPVEYQEPDFIIMQERWQQWCGQSKIDTPETVATQLIYIGLHTTDFEQARKEDIRHRLLMGGILFLLGCAGFYFLFLYQRIQVARTTLANLQIYTENVIESMPAGLITLDKDQHIVSCNTKAENLAGVPCATLKNQRLCHVFPTWPMTFFAEQEPLTEMPFSCPQNNGEPIPVKVSSSNLLTETGKMIGTVLILRDIRDIRTIEQQLERSRRLAALGQMATGIAHEIRNPLGTLRGFAQYFRKQFNKDDAGWDYADLMINEVDRLNHTISALLQFARPRDPDIAEIKLCDLLGKTYKLLEQDFTSKQLGFTLECSRRITLKTDPDLLLQVLINILKNSMESTPADGCIELGAMEDGGLVRLWVQDTGYGMSEEEKDRMFDPFFTTKKKGTGLGLAITHQIIEQLQGYFEVTSTPDQGTRIDIIFSPETVQG